jgi:hypothetical protein
MIVLIGCGLASTSFAAAAPPADAVVTVDTGDAGKRISTDLFGIFFEDTGDIILKLVNVLPSEVRTRINLRGARSNVLPAATCTVPSCDPAATNRFADPLRISPRTTGIAAAPSFDYPAPPHSLTVTRLKSR